MTGEYDKEKTLQLHAPFLTSQICHAFFDPQFVEKNIKLGVSEVINYCKKQIIHHNSHSLSLDNLPVGTICIAGEKETMMNIPKDIAQNGYTYDNSFSLRRGIINDQRVFIINFRKLDKDYTLKLTSIVNPFVKTNL